MTPLDAQIAAMRASGSTLEDTGAAVGISYASVSRRSHKPDVKSLIESLTTEFMQKNVSKLLQASSDALQVHAETWHTIKDAKTIQDRFAIAKDGKELIEATDRIAKRASQVMGILPSAAPSFFVQNIFSGPTNVVLGDHIAGMLSGASRPQDDDSIDAEWEELGDVD